MPETRISRACIPWRPPAAEPSRLNTGPSGWRADARHQRSPSARSSLTGGRNAGQADKFATVDGVPQSARVLPCAGSAVIRRTPQCRAVGCRHLSPVRTLAILGRQGSSGGGVAGWCFAVQADASAAELVSAVGTRAGNSAGAAKHRASAADADLDDVPLG
jgi:hypothetical protein